MHQRAAYACGLHNSDVRTPTITTLPAVDNTYCTRLAQAAVRACIQAPLACAPALLPLSSITGDGCCAVMPVALHSHRMELSYMLYTGHLTTSCAAWALPLRLLVAPGPSAGPSAAPAQQPGGQPPPQPGPCPAQPTPHSTAPAAQQSKAGITGRPVANTGVANELQHAGASHTVVVMQD
jgi:hypothetical protein